MLQVEEASDFKSKPRSRALRTFLNMSANLWFIIKLYLVNISKTGALTQMYFHQVCKYV